MGTAETRRALERAEAALPAWSGLLAKERARILSALGRPDDRARGRARAAAHAPSRASRSPSRASRSQYAASFFEWFGEEAKRVYGDTIPTYALDRRIVVTKSPIGVDGRHHAVELPRRDADAEVGARARRRLHDGAEARGADAALTALAIARLGAEAGVPDGVFQLVTGSAEDAPMIGAELTGNPLVRKLGFTGSTEVGKLLMAQCAKQVKKVSLELGGNAPFIVFDDADLDAAVAGALICKFRNSGQTCISANRIFVQDGIYDTFVSRLVDAASKLKVGNGLDADTNVGPLIEQAALDKVQRHVGDAVERGGEVLLGGEGIGGLFWQPTVITGVTGDAAMSCEETFGPVAGIARFTTEAEAVRDANDTPYGLAAYYYTRDIRAHLAAVGVARVRHPRHQHRPHLLRGRAVRRRQGVGHRPRGLEVRHRGVARDQVPLHRWSLGVRQRRRRRLTSPGAAKARQTRHVGHR